MPARISTTAWDAAVGAFLAEKRRANCSPATLSVYGMCLRGPRTQRWREESEVRFVDQLTSDALRSLEDSLFGGGLKPASVAVYHRTLKTFARWCIDEGYGLEARILSLPGPKLEERAPATFTAAEQAAIEAACRLARDRVIVRVLLHTGLRLTELTGRDLTDVVEGPDGAWLRVRQGKGRKDRVVPLDGPAWQGSRELRRYVLGVRPRDTTQPALFLTSRRGQTGDYARLNPHSVKVMLRRIGEATGIHVHAHKFRHTFVTESLAAGVPLAVVQRIVGHSTPAMTSRYEHFAPHHIVRAWSERR